MKKLQPLPFVLLVLSALCIIPAFTGCGTLTPDGPYGGDRVLYDADTAITTSYDAFHGFVTWEYQNREALSAWPQIKLAADNVRLNARQWINSSIALREAYVADPNSGTRSALNSSIAVLRVALVEAAKYMAAHSPPPSSTQ